VNRHTARIAKQPKGEVEVLVQGQEVETPAVERKKNEHGKRRGQKAATIVVGVGPATLSAAGAAILEKAKGDPAEKKRFGPTS